MYTMELYIFMTEGSESAWASYSSFVVGDNISAYRLHVAGYLAASTAGDALSYHNGMKFSTLD